MLPKAARKERLLTALTRMNDRDTQKAAAEELLAIVHVSLRAAQTTSITTALLSEPAWGQCLLGFEPLCAQRHLSVLTPAGCPPCVVQNMDQEGLPVLITCLCSTGGEQKVYARKVRGWGRAGLGWHAGTRPLVPRFRTAARGGAGRGDD